MISTDNVRVCKEEKICKSKPLNCEFDVQKKIGKMVEKNCVPKNQKKKKYASTLLKFC